jgi:outer membrane receptor protein involved in Fe transport
MFGSFVQLSQPKKNASVADGSSRDGLPRPRAVALACATLAALACTQAAAQTGQGAQPGGNEPATTAITTTTATPPAAGAPFEVVTVTATRRREPLRDVPLKVETLSVSQLEGAGAAWLDDYVGGLPGVHVSNDGGPGRGQVEIRGVSVGSAGAPTVGTYVDEVAFGSSTSFVGEAVAALDMSLLDLHHIELLRGPQGTLYGAGAMGGLLKYVTNQPDPGGFAGKASVGIRGTRNGALGHTESAVLNVPLSEGVAAMRIAVFNEHDGGYVTAVGRASGKHVNDGDTRGARLSVLLDPSDKMRIRLTGTHQDIKRNGTALVQYDTVTGQPINGDLTHRLAQAEPYTIKTDLLSADLEYDFGWARLNLIGSAQRFKANTVLDATDIVGSPDFNFAELDNDTVLRKQTQEVRLTSARGVVEWLVGYYHNKETGQRNQRLFAQMAADNSNFDLVRVDQPSRYAENALYGDITYNPAPAWSFTVGARVARNKQNYGTVTNGVKDFEAPADDKSTTYLATARYSIDKVSSVYVRAASGYRPGGPNPPAIDQNGKLIAGAPLAFGADTLWSYEVGYKADLLDKRLYVEAALFDIRWDKLQQPLAVGATTLTTNAGKAGSKGLELVARYKLDRQWSVDGALAVTDAKLSEDAPALGPSGSRLPNSARVSTSAGARYAFELAGKASYAGLNVRHVGQRNAGFDSASTSIPNFSLAAYTVFDAQFGVDMGAWQLAAFARNLADKRALAGGDTALTAFGGPLRATPIQPRTVGMTVSAAF